MICRSELFISLPREKPAGDCTLKFRGEATAAAVSLGAESCVWHLSLRTLHHELGPKAASNRGYVDEMMPSDANSDPQRDFAEVAVRTLRNAGLTALWAGGCVRD